MSLVEDLLSLHKAAPAHIPSCLGPRGALRENKMPAFTVSRAKIREADMKRQRGRNRRSGGGGNNPNRHFESNGPDVKIRGSAQQVLDKYLQYARDAQTSGDRVMSEAYFQHAEHYQRLLSAMQPKEKPKRDRDERDDETAQDGEADADEKADAEAGDGAGDNEKSEKPRRGRSRSRRSKDESGETSQDDSSQSDPLKVIDGDDASDEAPKPRRRRSYKKKDAEAETSGATDDDTDGVMKTLSRGRSEPAEASGSGDESSTAPAAE